MQKPGITLAMWTTVAASPSGLISTAYTAKGVQNKGAYVCLDTGKAVSIKAVQLVAHAGSWATILS